MSRNNFNFLENRNVFIISKRNWRNKWCSLNRLDISYLDFVQYFLSSVVWWRFYICASFMATTRSWCACRVPDTDEAVGDGRLNRLEERRAWGGAGDGLMPWCNKDTCEQFPDHKGGTVYPPWWGGGEGGFGRGGSKWAELRRVNRSFPAKRKDASAGGQQPERSWLEFREQGQGSVQAATGTGRLMLLDLIIYPIDLFVC